MTPNNIVNMARLKGLDIIAVTDHNSCGNCAAVMAAAEGTGLQVIPGMELCTSEEVHILCLFSSLDGAVRFWRMVEKGMPNVKNRPEIFGRQLYIDANDDIVGEEEKLLTAASGVSVDEVVEIVRSYGGVAVPAHIDRPSYSVLSVLGSLPPELGFSSVEVTARGDASALLPKTGKQYRVLVNSDAHTLGDIAEKEHSLEIKGDICANLLKSLSFPFDN